MTKRAASFDDSLLSDASGSSVTVFDRMMQRSDTSAEDVDFEPKTKKAKTANTPAATKTADQILSMSESALKASPKDQLVQHLLILQAHIYNISSAGASSKQPTTEQMEAQGEKLAQTIRKGIRSQMVWK